MSRAQRWPHSPIELTTPPQRQAAGGQAILRSGPCSRAPFEHPGVLET